MIFTIFFINIHNLLCILFPKEKKYIEKYLLKEPMETWGSLDLEEL